VGPLRVDGVAGGLSSRATDRSVNHHTGVTVPKSGHHVQRLAAQCRQPPLSNSPLRLAGIPGVSLLAGRLHHGQGMPAAPANRDEADLSTAAPPGLHFAPVLLLIAALALGAVGITINGWFARSLGSSDMAGWLFFAVGVMADLVAFILPSTAAGLWQARQRAIALVGWTVWLVTFIFAVTASIGFASTNISDVSLARASRGTPAIRSAQVALADAMAARDRECKGGVGKFCCEREAAVAEQRQILDSTMRSVGQAADPQTDAAIKLVAWISRGVMRPAPEDFAMLRLFLLTLLPQIGGMLLIGRHSQTTRERRYSRLSDGRHTGWARIFR
jgi:hypothetical protein